MMPNKRDELTLNKSVIKYLPRCTYHLLYSVVSGLCLVAKEMEQEVTTTLFYHPIIILPFTYFIK